VKKVTRYACPYCGKNNWDVSVCDEHAELWLEEYRAQMQRKYLDYRNDKHISYIHNESDIYDEEYLLLKEATNLS
jgi:hypothetical protein